MTSMPDSMFGVTAGVDTHRDFHVGAVLDGLGRVLATDTFPATGAGYQSLLAWLETFGRVLGVGVEGSGAWGAGLTRFLTAGGIEVVEVVRPNRQSRRRHGKSDTTDAIAAARAVLSGEASGQPRGGEGPVESLRLLKVARRSAVKQRTMVANQIHSVVVTAPEQLRSHLRGLPIEKMVTLMVDCRPGDASNPLQAAKITLKALTRRHRYLTPKSENSTVTSKSSSKRQHHQDS
ncbi:MAG: transposase [Acidimicrobiia bacterium]